jgi:hypothetical protein
MTIIVAGAKRLFRMGFVWNQGVAGHCGNGMKGY